MLIQFVRIGDKAAHSVRSGEPRRGRGGIPSDKKCKPLPVFDADALNSFNRAFGALARDCVRELFTIVFRGEGTRWVLESGLTLRRT